MHLAAQIICMLVVGKEANTFSTLHGIANCVKNGTRKIVSSNRYKRLVRCSVAHTYFWSSLRILFSFLETKTELWKLMRAISGCCIGSSGSPFHPALGFSVLLFFWNKSNLYAFKRWSDIVRIANFIVRIYKYTMGSCNQWSIFYHNTN